jgi:hypothetical protein
MSSTTDSNTVKMLEQTIQKEAKAEEKNVQLALKDLKSAEKSDGKASKVTHFLTMLSMC